MRIIGLAILSALALSACAHRAPAVSAAPSVAAATSAPLFAAPLSAVPLSESADRDVSKQPAGTYEIDPRHTSVIWRVRHAGQGLYVGRFDRFEGTLRYDPAKPEASTLNVSIDAKSAAGRTEDAAFFAEIANDVFDAAKHPKITFEASALKAIDATNAEIIGALTLAGETGPATLRVQFEGGKFSVLQRGHVLAFSATTTIDRKDFKAKFDNPLKDAFVGDIVEILVSAEFVRE